MYSAIYRVLSITDGSRDRARIVGVYRINRVDGNGFDAIIPHFSEVKSTRCAAELGVDLATYCTASITRDREAKKYDFWDARCMGCA